MKYLIPLLFVIGACCRLPISEPVQEVTVIVQGEAPRNEIRYAFEQYAMPQIKYDPQTLVGSSSFFDEQGNYRWIVWTGYFKTDKKKAKPETISVTVVYEDGIFLYE